MKQNEISPPAGASRDRKRVGRGHGSGNVKTAGRGQKGQKSRSGGNLRLGFEGGQRPLIFRMPYKRGFTSPFKKEYQIVKLSDLSQLDQPTEVTLDSLTSLGLVSPRKSSADDFRVKVLGDGEISVPLRVRVHKVSASARQKIEAAGGSVEEIE